jgi:hypothetical protein
VTQKEKRRSKGTNGRLKCGGCGGPHRFDTSVPSVIWNEVIRRKGLSEYLCTSCVLREFVREGQSFTAELYGDGMSGVPVEFRVSGQVAVTAAKVNDENNTLRSALDRIHDIAQDPASHLTHAAIQDIAAKALLEART